MSGRTTRIDVTTARRVLRGYGAFALVASRHDLPALCSHRILTGRACPMCGLTRSVGHALRGDVRRAAALHPLGVAVAVLVMAELVSLGVRAIKPRAQTTGRARYVMMP